VKVVQGKVVDEAGRVLAVFDSGWKWERQLAVARIRFGNVGDAGDCDQQPLDPEVKFECAAGAYQAQRESCAATWREVLARGMN